MSRSQNKAKVVAYLNRHVGDPVSVEQICDATELTRKQAQGVMYHLIATGTVKVLARGHSWIYNPAAGHAAPPPPEQATVVDKLEVVGRTRDGAMLARDPDGILYSVRELEI